MSFTRLLLAAIVISTSFLTAPLTGYSQKPADPESLAAYEKAEELSRKVNVLLRSASKETRTEAVLLLDNVVDLYVRAGSKKEAASYRNVQGVQFRLLGDTKRQLEAYQKALELYRSAGHREGEALSMFNIADVYSETGDTDKAIHYLQLCLPIFEAEKSLYYQSMVLRSLADLYRDLGSPREALVYKLKALAVDRTTTQTWNEADTLSEIAQLYTELGETERALSFLQQALSLVRKSKNFWGQSKVHNKLGQHYLGIGDAKSAQLHHTQALALIRRLDPGFVSLHGEATTLVHIAAVHAHARNWKQAESIFAEARSMIHRIGNPETDAWALQRIGRMHSEKGDLEAALKAFSEELQIRRSIGDKPGEALALYRVSESHAMAGSGRLAILFGKLSVNAYQELRKSLNAFDHEVRRSYMAIVETAYKHLADLLIEEGRLPEAQAVLAMLKEEEAFEYIRRDASETALLNRRADLREDEKAALKEYEKLAEAIGAVGAEFGKLQDAKSSLPSGASLSADDQKRLDELGKQLEAANTAFQVFLRQLAEEFEKKAVVQDIQENAGLQADLKGWGEGVVSLYTIVGEDRYRVVLTTPNVQVDGKTEIKGADLNKKIAAFRAAVQDTRIDPRPLGKEIYEIVVKPIEKQLEGAKTKTILWSLDGSLRYLPLAALWDGKQYFGQKYQNVVVTLASRTRLSDQPGNEWRLLGLGVTAAKQLTEPNGTRTISFSALPAVRSELSAIVREERAPGDPGVIDGTSLFDDEFTEQSLKDRLAQRFKVIHIASHFSFRPGDMTRSFLLLGDGTALTMAKFKTSPQLRFNGVELLTLSACDTAVGEPDANGKEVESFAVIAQQNGAKAVLATLWPVADESTSAFMTEFYRIKNERPSASKSDALQMAQTAMIEGAIRSSEKNLACRADNFGSGSKDRAFKCDPKAPFSHPYFWSPFILIGNWR